jgi:hypothetical protein
MPCCSPRSRGVLRRPATHSPAGLAAWAIEKFHGWSDCGQRVRSSFINDELTTNVMIYWLTQSIGISFTPCFDYAHAGPQPG